MSQKITLKLYKNMANESKPLYIPTKNALNARERETFDPTSLINYLTKTRKFQHETYFKNNPKVLELEKYYGKYLLVPLAIPLFELPDQDHFLQWWKNNAIRPVKQNGDYVATTTGRSPFESVDIIQKVGNDWNLNLKTNEFIKEFPLLWQQVHDTLPCDDILVWNLWSSVEEFTEHRDSAEMLDFPASFRILLYDTNPYNTLFIMDNPTKPFKVCDTKFLPNLSDTNTFMWNNLRSMHGSVYNPQYKKILAVIIGLINIEKYDTVLRKSITNYNRYCYTSDYSLENYVNV